MNDSVLTIEQFNLRLPPGFEKRADAIARDVARQLARMPVAQSIELKALTLPAVRIVNGETNQMIARRIALSIHSQMTNYQQHDRSSRTDSLRSGDQSQTRQKEQHRGIG